MKGILTTIQEKAGKALLLTVLAGAIASCDSVLDYDEGDCSIKYRVKFKYDYNMDEVDAFAKQVRTVTLYAFEKRMFCLNVRFVVGKNRERRFLSRFYIQVFVRVRYC